MSSAPISFSGLASGLDTASIISELMSVESQPQTALKSRVASEQTQVSALQSINTALAALVSSADSFTTGSTWTQLAATSSNAAVSVTAASTATPTNLTVQVLSTATPAQLSFTSAKELTDLVATPNTNLTLTTADGTALSVNTGDGTLQTLVTNINAATTGATGAKPLVTASLVGAGTAADGQPQYKLLIASNATGAGSLSISGDSASSWIMQGTSYAGSDAQIDIGAGLQLSSSTNTFTGVLPGVDLTIAAGTAAGTTSQVAITDDGTSRASAMSAFVSQINSVLKSIATSTAYGTITAGQAATNAGVLAGNPDLRGIATNLLNTIFAPGPASSAPNLAQWGLSVDTTGNITFDQTAFATAYQADPSAVTAAFTGTDGFVQRVKTVATQASDPYDGTLTAAINSQNDEISNLNDQISAWDIRLADKQAQLNKQYSDLETTLASLQSQSSWLASQLSSLDSGWSQNN